MMPRVKRLVTTWPEVNSGFIFRDYIKSKHAGLRLLQFYVSVHPASGAVEEWDARIPQGQIAVNSVPVLDPKYVLRVGDIVSYTRLPWREPPSPSHVDILYEDEDLVALSKPSGLQVLPAAMFHQRTVLALLQQHYRGPMATDIAVAAHIRAGVGAGADRASSPCIGPKPMMVVVEVLMTPAAGGSSACSPVATATTGPEEAGAGAELLCGHVSPAADRDGGGDVRGGGGGNDEYGVLQAVDGYERRSQTSPVLSPPPSCQQAQLQQSEWSGKQQQGQQRQLRRCGKASGEKMMGVPAPVHRLGRGTSGLLLCARTPSARRALTDLMAGKTAAAAAAATGARAEEQSRQSGAGVDCSSGSQSLQPLQPQQQEQQQLCTGIPLRSEAMMPLPQPPPLRKIYRALVQGCVPEDQGRVDVPIGPISHPGVCGGLFAATPDGKPATSLWRVLERRWGPAADESGGDAAPDSGRGTSSREAAPAISAAGAAPAIAAAIAAGDTTAASAGGHSSKVEAVASAAECRAEGVHSLLPPPPQQQVAQQRELHQQQQLEEEKGEEEARLDGPHAASPGDGGGSLEQTLMEVEILTGRPHQIRIHMAAMGHPLVGDPLYGIGGRPRVELKSAALAATLEGNGPADPRDGGFGRPGDCGYHLHSLELHLPHPTTGQPLLLRAPPPPLLMTKAELQLHEGSDDCSVYEHVARAPSQETAETRNHFEL